MSLAKRAAGRYYTIGDPFSLMPFGKWAGRISLKDKAILEPFAGSNNIIELLRRNGFADEYESFDIKPAERTVRKRDTLKRFPKGYEVVITNPPWLARNSAKRRGLDFPETKFDDLYKHCLDVCLENCPYVGALIPATFLQSGLFADRLDTFIMLHDKNLFMDTDNPVALALFSPKLRSAKPRSSRIYHDNKFIGNLEQLKSHLPEARESCPVRFNSPEGRLGFIAFDNTREPTIRFCEGEELSRYQIKHTTRMITRIELDVSYRRLKSLIRKLNREIERFRLETRDVFLTPFKGLRSDGMYRRRMEFSMARNFILENV